MEQRAVFEDLIGRVFKGFEVGEGDEIVGEIGIEVGEVDLLERGGRLMGEEGAFIKEVLLCSSGDGGLLGVVRVIEKLWERRGLEEGGVVGSVIGVSVGVSRVSGSVLGEMERWMVSGELIC